MSSPKPTLYLICGKICAGKSSLARRLADENQALLISQDEWMSTLYPEEVKTIKDYGKYVRRLSSIMGRHVQQILAVGTSVVLDFPANTKEVRGWMRSIFEGAGCAHELHYLDISDDTCKARLKNRNAEGVHEYQISEKEYDLFTDYFVSPQPEEGFEIITHAAD